MRNRPTVSRRTFLATAGATTLVAVAGCQGDGDGDGEETGTEGESESDSTGDSDGTETASGTAEGGETIELRGQEVVSETITEDTIWEYDMDQGDVLTAVVEPAAKTGADSRIREKDDQALLAEANPAPDHPDRMQYTAESDGTYVVDIHVLDPSEESTSVDVEIYLEE